MVKYLQLVLIRAGQINACTLTNPRTRVYAKSSYKNTIYTTSPVEEMGQNPVFTVDGTNVCHFVYENEAECITLELYNRNDTCIGYSRLSFTELARLRPEQVPEEKTLPVLVASGGYEKPFGTLILTAQIKHQKAVGEEGNLNIEIKEGFIKKLTSLFARTAKMNAKFIYKHTTLVSGTLEGMGNKFVWHADNTFTFIINSSQPDDVLEIKLYNGSSKVGQCKILMSLLIADSGVPRTADLLVKNKNVGSVEVIATFIKTPIGRRHSYPQDHDSTSSLYPPWKELHLRNHHSQPMPNIYCGSSTEGSLPSSPPQSPHRFYPPEQPHVVQPGNIPRPARGPYEPSAPIAPPAFHSPPVYPPGAQVRQPEAHGAPPGREYFKDDPLIGTFVDNFH